MIRKLLPLSAVVVVGGVAAGVSSPADSVNQSARETSFAIRVENVSTAATLELSDGTTAPAPTAPVLWLVHTNTDPLFTDGRPDRGRGLETLAEDGNPEPLAMALHGAPGVLSVGAVAVPQGDREPGAITPGKAFQFTVTARPGQLLTLAMMFGQSNDLFYAPHGSGIALFDQAGRPIRGDITSHLVLWDAGTEVNQEPGAGPDQAPRQAGPNMGAAEHGTVRVVSDRFRYPDTREVIRVTIEPLASTTSNGR